MRLRPAGECPAALTAAPPEASLHVLEAGVRSPPALSARHRTGLHRHFDRRQHLKYGSEIVMQGTCCVIVM